MDKMTRGELAKQTGISTSTIRYYEDSGILPAPKRIANGYRVYTDDYLVKIKFIKDAKSLGYSLKEIKEILQMLSQEMDGENLKGLVKSKSCEIEERIKTLHSIQRMLTDLLNTSEEDIQNYLQSFRI
ncbi:transcriptional regulator [Clostridium botulinum]|uniref:Transcriptional regulator n=2 Tax=Clostridium TaxID=1485 RepID=A0AAU8YTJ0_CLOBO|nr:transcriptional regulator [Clostridium botulinum]NFG01232.1 MerR family transcriptional regulator [Clostridium sporogenes]NFM15942.1 MerR family transcriptional regulator [Clostridium sporogenes]